MSPRPSSKPARERSSRRKALAPPPAPPPAAESPSTGGESSQFPLVAGASLMLALTSLAPTEAGDRGAALPAAAGWLLLAVAPIGAALARRQPSRIVASWPLSLLLAMSLWMAATAGWMSSQGSLRNGCNMAWTWLGAAACLWALAQAARTLPARRVLLAVALALSSGQAFHGLFQYAWSAPQRQKQWRESTEQKKREILAANQINPDADAPERKLFEDRLGSTEPTASFNLANSLAGALAASLILTLALPLAMGFGAHPTDSAWRAGLLRFALWCIPLALALVLTKSRTAWIAAGVGVAALALWDAAHTRRLGWRLLALGGLGGLACVATGILAGALDRQVLTEAIKSLAYRAQYWQATLRIVGDHPWFGCGAGNFQSYYAQYKLPSASETVADPHNFVLELAATGGLPGACAALLGLTWWLLSKQPLNERPSAAADRADADRADADADRQLRAAMWGAGLGLLLGWPLTLMLMYPVEPLAESFPLPVAWATASVSLAAFYWGWWPWIRRVNPSPALLKIAGAALLINLLAAGGISFLAVLQILWLTIALSSPTVADPADDSGGATPDGSRWIRRRPVQWLILLAGLALVAMLWQTALNPVLKRQLLEADFAAASSPSRATAILRAAAAADPRSEAPWRSLGQLSFTQWRRTRAEADWRQFIDAMNQALLRRRHDARLHAEFGELLCIGFVEGQAERSAWKLARDHLERAAELAPSAISHARLAWAYHWGGLPEQTQRWAQSALQRDALNPHIAYKLEKQKLWTPAGQRNAEQFLGNLRKQPG